MEEAARKQSSAGPYSSQTGRNPQLRVTYSPAADTFQTQVQDSHGSVLINRMSHPPQLSATDLDSKDKRPKAKNTLLNSLIHRHGTYSDNLLVYLLGATIFASFLNTFLLSFVVKSIQMNDRGFINGRLTWDEQANRTLLHLLARVLPGKSISVRAIESFGDKPLRLDIGSRALVGDEPNNDTRSISEVEIFDGGDSSGENLVNYKPPASNDDGSFLIVGPPIGQPPAKRSGSQVADDYLVLNQKQTNPSTNAEPSNGHSSLGISRELGTLEIKTDELMLDVIDDELSKKQDGTNNLLASAGRQQEFVTDFTNQDADNNWSGGKRTLLNIASKFGSISLPFEDQINLNSAKTNLLVADHLVKCSNITGSLEENLDIQTRDANLICRSDGTLRLIAKSGGIKMTAFEEMVLESNSIIMRSSKKLYIPSGIQYLDSEPETSNEIYPSSHANSENPDQLSAYNLVVVNGILMGSVG